MGPRGQAEAVLQCIFLEAQQFLYTSQPLFQAYGCGARLPRSPARSRMLAGGKRNPGSLQEGCLGFNAAYSIFFFFFPV